MSKNNSDTTQLHVISISDRIIISKKIPGKPEQMISLTRDELKGIAAKWGIMNDDNINRHFKK